MMTTQKKIPERMCVACRQMKPKTELVRIVRQPTGEVTVDATGKVNGRGVYVCKCIDCVVKLRKFKNFQKHNGFALSEEILRQLEKAVEQ